MSTPPFTKPKTQLTWLITGCSSGLGLSLARLALSQGHTVIATSRNPSSTPLLVSEVENYPHHHQNKSRWIQLDVDDRASSDIVERLEKEDGIEIDVLVNNAGFSVLAPVETASEDEVRAHMESMYFGPLRLVRAVLPHMRRRRYGVVVNFSSGAALDGRDAMGAYAGAKAGLDGITRVLAKEVAPFNIRVLTVVLGAFNTNMPSATAVGKVPLPDDYRGSASDKMIQFLTGGSMPGPAFVMSDKDKAMKVVYEMVLGEGIGAGREAERLLPLGSDMTARVKGAQEYLGHALGEFKDVTNSVGIDR
ncbi:putative short-chain oxidoreductase [Hypoxylon fragiforme]|uniref:putative short-chain oxidoreductase n=1 Tax=Hypoxylon fragiforme TaxID=63214 RepID=UPI0020C6DA19|nr:putative short-chain oxidoreductase [Hypoxylon fragiforme]KAI2614213.1 putative short-chain oxidoreductase [Hypoxylon fragiforme]